MIGSASFLSMSCFHSIYFIYYKEKGKEIAKYASYFYYYNSFTQYRIIH